MMSDEKLQQQLGAE